MANKISELMQAHRSKKIAKDGSQLQRLEEKRFQSSKDQKRIDYLKGRIAKNQKLNDIAQNNANTRAQIQIARASATKVDNSHKSISRDDHSKTGVVIENSKILSGNTKSNPPKASKTADKKGPKKTKTKTKKK